MRRGETRIAELAPLGGADQLAATVLAAVSTTEIVSRIPDEADTATRLLAALAGRELLLVLDNCEHLVDAAAHLVQTLLERIPGLRILATSREPLAVPGEVLHPVDALADDDAVRLFAERGAAVAPGFAVTGRAPADRPRDLPPPRRAAPADRAGRRPAAHPGSRARSAAASTTGSGCSPPARGPRCRATRRCAPSSTGAGTCSTTRSGRSPGGCPSSPAARPRRPRCACAGSATRRSTC